MSHWYLRFVWGVLLLFGGVTAAWGQNFGNVNPMSTIANMDKTAAKPVVPTPLTILFSNITSNHGTIGQTNTIFSNDGASIARIADRVLIGAEAIKNSSDNPRTTGTWLSNDPNLAYLDVFSTLQVMNVLSGPAATFAAKTSTCTISVCGGQAGGPGGAAIAAAFIAWNDDTRVATTYGNNAWGNYIEVHRKNGVGGGTVGIELDTVNFGSTVDLDPFWQGLTPALAGYTLGIALNAGGGNAGSNPPSVAMLIAGNAAVWRKGIVFSNGGIQGGAFGAGFTVAVESPLYYGWRWMDSGGLVWARIWGEASGVHVSGSATGAFTYHGAGTAVIGTNIGATPPLSGSTSWAISDNYQSLREVDFWNVDTAATTMAFSWFRKLDDFNIINLMKIDAAGGLTVAGGITASALPSSGAGSPAYVCVDGVGKFYRGGPCI